MDFSTLYSFINNRVHSNGENKAVTILSNLGYKIKDKNELNTFLGFVDFLRTEDTDLLLTKFSDYFIFGYQIPQLGKEMDLIRFGTNYNLNIEYKISATREKMVEQLKKNHFYLNFLNSPTKYYSFSLGDGLLIEYHPESDVVTECSAKSLLKVLENQNIEVLNQFQADSKFDIKNYLVSPFNDVERFINSEYLLTPPQYNYKEMIINSASLLHSVTGKPGTGKTLLLYDLAKELMKKGKNVYILHCANLNEGQVKLKQHGYNIIAIKNYKEIDFENADVILVDESQRVRLKQRDEIIERAKENNVKLIFFMDGEQTLHDNEAKAKNVDYISDLVSKNEGKNLKLREKYRSNPDLGNFIKLFLKFPIDPKKIVKVSNHNNIIRVKYFGNYDSADCYIKTLIDFQVLNYSRSKYNHEGLDLIPRCGRVSHEVIGQEFENVTVILDKNFHYRANLDGNSMILVAENSYYNAKKMLYQNLTRARKKIEIVIIDNPNLLFNISKIIDF